jgi:sec-independent protein translocase protein TatA
MLLFLESIGTMEVILIMLVILMFFGSKSIPDISRTIGRTMRDVRDATQGIKDEINKSTQEMRSEFDETRSKFKNELDISKHIDEAKSAVNDSSTVEELKQIRTDLNAEPTPTKEITEEDKA